MKIDTKKSLEATTPEVKESSEVFNTKRGGNAGGGLMSWHSSAKMVCCVNSYPNGVTVSLHSREKLAKDVAALSGQPFALRFRDTRNYQIADGSYFLYKKNLRASLEKHLSHLHKKGLLSSTVIYFGTTVDPFANFHKRFDQTNLCLELFEKYKPMKLVVQSRSPMVISALGTLKSFEEKAVVVIPIETNKESSVAKYTPGQTKIAQRLLAAQGLRTQGVCVSIAVTPVLPYGDISRDAWDFAELLDRYADYITLGCLASGAQQDEKILQSLAVAKKLESEGLYEWLRPNAYKSLAKAVKTIAAHKLVLPVSEEHKSSQMALFAA